MDLITIDDWANTPALWGGRRENKIINSKLMHDRMEDKSEPDSVASTDGWNNISSAASNRSEPEEGSRVPFAASSETIGPIDTTEKEEPGADAGCSNCSASPMEMSTEAMATTITTESAVSLLQSQEDSSLSRERSSTTSDHPSQRPFPPESEFLSHLGEFFSDMKGMATDCFINCLDRIDCVLAYSRSFVSILRQRIRSRP
jgi:hypothetical protein